MLTTAQCCEYHEMIGLVAGANMGTKIPGCGGSHTGEDQGPDEGVSGPGGSIRPCG